MTFGRSGMEWNKAILVIILAVFLAVFFILIVTLIQQRRLEERPRTTIVGGQTVILDAPQELVPILDAEPTAVPQPVVTAVPEPVEVPTAIPITEAPTPTPSTQEIIFESYIVREGDTLYSISNRYLGTNIALMARYGISSKSLVVGREIQLPHGNPAFCVTGRPYAVQEGDTLFSLSRRFNINVDQLRQMNDLHENTTIYVARIICVP
jgi:LysM repeat protein